MLVKSMPPKNFAQSPGANPETGILGRDNSIETSKLTRKNCCSSFVYTCIRIPSLINLSFLLFQFGGKGNMSPVTIDPLLKHYSNWFDSVIITNFEIKKKSKSYIIFYHVAEFDVAVYSRRQNERDYEFCDFHFSNDDASQNRPAYFCELIFSLIFD